MNFHQCWLLHFSIKKGATAFGSRIALRSKSSRKRQKEGTLTTSCEVRKDLPETYAPHDVIAKTEAEVMTFTKLLNKIPIEYEELDKAKPPCCN